MTDQPDPILAAIDMLAPSFEDSGLDELELSIGGMPARTHASQGEQRTLALALRLGVHHLVAERTGSTPVLVLDDVLSELDAHRAAALLDLLPAGQIIITTAGVFGIVLDRSGRDRS